MWWPADSNECRFGYHCRRQASDCCNLQRGSINKLISPLIYNFVSNPSMAALSNPFQRGSQGWGTLVHQNHGAGGGNSSIMVGMFVCLCLVSKKASKREFFVPAGTDLGVKLLTGVLKFALLLLFWVDDVVMMSSPLLTDVRLQPFLSLVTSLVVALIGLGGVNLVFLRVSPKFITTFPMLPDPIPYSKSESLLLLQCFCFFVSCFLITFSS